MGDRTGEIKEEAGAKQTPSDDKLVKVERLGLKEVLEKLEGLESLDEKLAFLKAVYGRLTDKEVKKKIGELFSELVKARREPGIRSFALSPRVVTRLEDMGAPVFKSEERPRREERQRVVFEEPEKTDTAYLASKQLQEEAVGSEYHRMEREHGRRNRAAAQFAGGAAGEEGPALFERRIRPAKRQDFNFLGSENRVEAYERVITREFEYKPRKLKRGERGWQDIP